MAGHLMMIELVEKHRGQIEELCRRYRVKKLELFGSAASSRFDPTQSDIDFFYELDDKESLDYADRFFALNDGLQNLLGHKVDLVSAKDATNPYFLQVANRNRIPLYAA